MYKTCHVCRGKGKALKGKSKYNCLYCRGNGYTGEKKNE
jgi:hypothetical protein